MSWAGTCARCDTDKDAVTFVGDKFTCKDCLFDMFERRQFREILPTCASCDQPISVDANVYCQTCAECSMCDTLAYNCEDHGTTSRECDNCSDGAEYCSDCAYSLSECEESHGCHYCGNYEEVYCSECAERNWFNRECDDCGGQDDVDRHYCTTCDGQREYKDQTPIEVLAKANDDGTIEIDGMSVSWN